MSEIEQAVRRLKLSGMTRNWRDAEYRDNEQYVTELPKLELRKREANRINRMVKTAGFPAVKTLDAFEWNRGIALPAGLTRESMEGLRFLELKEDLIFMGSVEIGKARPATAIALVAYLSRKKVRFCTAASLADALMEKNAGSLLRRFMTALKKTDLPVVDEAGFTPLHKDASELLFQVISDCYERKSLIIVSSLKKGLKELRKRAPNPTRSSGRAAVRSAPAPPQQALSATVAERWMRSGANRAGDASGAWDAIPHRSDIDSCDRTSCAGGSHARSNKRNLIISLRAADASLVMG